MENEEIFKFLGFLFMLMGILLFVYVSMEGLLLVILDIHIMTNPLFYLILGFSCFMMSLFERVTGKLAEGGDSVE